MKRKSIAIFLTVLMSFSLKAQKEAGIIPGNITPADFTISNPAADSSYGAVIIADIGESYFEESEHGSLTLVFKHRRRVKFYDHKGMDWATVRIAIYKSRKTDDAEKLISVKASTYNLVNGQVRETKLGENELFDDRISKYQLVKKFTLPAVKPGSIAEFTYEIKTNHDFFLPPWEFQKKIPCLWSEYVFNKPGSFDYVYNRKGLGNFFIDDTSEKYTKYYAPYLSIYSNNLIRRWVMKDMPAIKNEDFVYSTENFIPKLEFQYLGYKAWGRKYQSEKADWKTVSEELMNNEEFGLETNKVNGWLNKDLDDLEEHSSGKIELAKNIFSFVQKNFSSKGRSWVLTTQKLKDTYKAKTGYDTDINILLITMLKHKGLDARPVLLSTRDNARINTTYPMLANLNYVIVHLTIDGKEYFLDASNRHTRFNQLPAYCFNGPVIILGDPVKFRDLNASDITETKGIHVNLSADEEVKHWKGFASYLSGNLENSEFRKIYFEKGKSFLEKEIDSRFYPALKTSDIQLLNAGGGEKNMQADLQVEADINQNGKLIYITPVLAGIKENYFKATERKYPVELDSKIDETYTLQLQLPAGYTADELPLPVKVNLNGNDGSFEYQVTNSGTEIGIRSRVKINKTFFETEDYQSLRNFLDHIVKKHAEQIVLRKQ